MRLIIDKDVPVPMRDGVTLRADVTRPDGDARLPVILVRLPYGKSMLSMQTYAEANRLALAGYAVVHQDTRGRFASEGDFYPFRDEAQDGYDTVEWCAAQPWSSGNVGMTGGSYFGATQWLAATATPPHLKAIFPVVTASDYYEGWTYRGGALHLGFALLWALLLSPEAALRQSKGTGDGSKRVAELLRAVDDVQNLYKRLPLQQMPELERTALYFFDWLEHESLDEYWRQWRIADRYERIDVPAFHVGGWYDLFLGGTLENYLGMRERGGSAAARAHQRLLIAPWAHGAYSGAYAEYTHGSAADMAFMNLAGMQIRWFDRWLKGIDNGVDREPPVRLFVMGEGVWRDEQEWPLARTRFTPFYLHGQGRANSAAGNGTLGEAPAANEPPDVYTYDPRDPAPTVGGTTFLPGLYIAANAGPRDQQTVEARPDVLVYSTPPLAQDIEVTGPVEVVLYASTTAPDTDWTAKLVDVHEDGFARILCDGILRARYRYGLEKAEPVQPGAVEEYVIDLWATSNLFRAGHRIRLEISSSNFPHFDRNLNTGGRLGAESLAEAKPALQTVFHDAAHPSHLLLPIIPR
ncbi:MAG TPA: CocE/NonD family hydrolase [Dehalococcoidia bacterium]|nr:CocE/NonD family hydrolase [Dehalococcoidia bacterium]